MALLASLLLALPLLGCSILGLDEGGKARPKSGETTILFIGSSYLAFNNVPRLFEEFSKEAGHDVFVGTYLEPGRLLSVLVEDPGTKAIMREREWDFVVLQGGSQNVVYPRAGAESPFLALREFHRIATENSPDTRVVYMMPWAYEDGMLWVEGRDETYEVMQLDLRERVLHWAGNLDFIIAPVGMAWYEVLTTWDHGIHFLHEEDWNHASREGSYLTAATFFSTIHAESVSGVEFDWMLEPLMARNLREVASTTVMDSLALWKITP